MIGSAAAVAAILAGQRRGRLPDDPDPRRGKDASSGGLSLTGLLIVLTLALVIQILAYWGYSAWQEARVNRAAIASTAAVMVQEPVVGVHRRTHRWCDKGGTCTSNDTVDAVETSSHLLVRDPGVASGCGWPMNGQTLSGPTAEAQMALLAATPTGQTVRARGYTLRANSPWWALSGCPTDTASRAAGRMTVNGKTVVLLQAP